MPPPPPAIPRKSLICGGLLFGLRTPQSTRRGPVMRRRGSPYQQSDAWRVSKKGGKASAFPPGVR